MTKVPLISTGDWEVYLVPFAPPEPWYVRFWWRLRTWHIRRKFKKRIKEAFK